MTKKNNLASNLILLFISTILSLRFSELLLRFLRIGFNASPLNPSTTSHHEHPYSFESTSYSVYGEWEPFNMKFDQFGKRVLEDLCDWENVKEKSINHYGRFFC